MGHLFYRGEHFAISLDELDFLKLKGVIILIIEKRGIAELIRLIAEPSGIALLSTQGFLTENAIDLAYLTSRTGGKVAILTDYDISDIVIAHQVPEVPRIGIDEETLDDLNILNKQKDLEEYYTPNPSHKKTVEEDFDGNFPDVDLDYLSDRRIEINAVMKEVGRERFWQWIVSKLEDLFGEDLSYIRAVIIPEAIEFVPHELRAPNIQVIGRISTILEPERKAKYKELSHYDATVRGMIEDVSDYEKGIREEFQGIVNDRADMEAFFRRHQVAYQEVCWTTVTVIVILGGNQCYQQVLYERGKYRVNLTKVKAISQPLR